MKRPDGILIFVILYTIGGLYWIISGIESALIASSFGGIIGQFMLALGAIGLIFVIILNQNEKCALISYDFVSYC